METIGNFNNKIEENIRMTSCILYPIPDPNHITIMIKTNAIFVIAKE